MAEAKAETTKKAPKAKKAPKTDGTGRRGRVSQFAGKTIHKLVKENPRKPGTNGAKSWDALKSGMSYEKYIEAGGRRQDLDFDLKKKYVELRSK